MAPSPLLMRFSSLLEDKKLEGPVLDLACGRGEDGLFLAGLNLPVVLADRSPEALEVARRSPKDPALPVAAGLRPLRTDAPPRSSRSCHPAADS
jgi:methylase of polypeptide subunit release factors